MNADILTQKGKDRIPDSAIGLLSVTYGDVLDFPSRGLYVGSSGDVNVTMANGTTGVLKNLAAGIVHPLSILSINSVNTTATDLFYVL